MSRKVIDVMDQIFDVLKDCVGDEDKHRIVDIKRHVQADSNDGDVVEFVKKAKIQYFDTYRRILALVRYLDKRYIVVEHSYERHILDLGFYCAEDKEHSIVSQGTNMLLISSKRLKLQQDTNSLKIVDECLGTNEEVFHFSDLSKFFVLPTIIEIHDDIFELSYEEDIARLECYLVMYDGSNWSDESKKEIKELLMCKGSRSIVWLLLRASFDKFLEYTFLLLYQGIEYFFKIHSCIYLRDKYSIDIEKASDIVIGYERKISERDSLRNVLETIKSADFVDNTLKIFCMNGVELSGIECISNYLYDIRCSIAHFRLDQNLKKNVDFKQCNAVLINILRYIYSQDDKDIVRICTYRKAWTLLDY